MKYLAKILLILPRLMNYVLCKIMVPLFSKHGKNIKIFPLNSFFSYENIEIGNDVFIGPGAHFTSIKKIYIGNKIMFGPKVTIIGGDHNVSEVGMYMYDVEQKLEHNDQEIHIMDGCLDRGKCNYFKRCYHQFWIYCCSRVLGQ